MSDLRQEYERLKLAREEALLAYNQSDRDYDNATGYTTRADVDAAEKTAADAEAALDAFVEARIADSERLAALERLLLECDTVALNTGHPHGLCDSMDNSGNPYPSQYLHDLLEAARDTHKEGA